MTLTLCCTLVKLWIYLIWDMAKNHSKQVCLAYILFSFSYNNLGVARVKCPILILAVQSDILFPYFQQLEVAQILQSYGTPVTYYELRAKYPPLSLHKITIISNFSNIFVGEK